MIKNIACRSCNKVIQDDGVTDEYEWGECGCKGNRELLWCVIIPIMIIGLSCILLLF